MIAETTMRKQPQDAFLSIWECVEGCEVGRLPTSPPMGGLDIVERKAWLYNENFENK